MYDLDYDFGRDGVRDLGKNRNKIGFQQISLF